MEIPIFPLNGAVLFPGTSLPLNIFEKRYLEMVDYALSKKRCIGMIQSDKKNKLYNIGCIGKIHSFSETTDGRYLISLQGTNCFKVKKELEKKISNFISTGIEWVPLNAIEITGEKKEELINFFDTLEEDDDVQNIYSNVKFLD